MPEFFKENIIISADDFGDTPKDNASILSLIRLGKLSRVAVLAEGVMSPAEIKILNESGVKLDLHLDLPKFNPGRRGTKRRESALRRIFYFLFLYLTGKLSAKSTNLLWEAQIKKFEILFGRKPDGLNSHQHIHFFPPYFKVAAELGQKHGIRYLRLGTSDRRYLNLVSFVLNTFRSKNIPHLPGKNLETSDFLISLDWIIDMESFLVKKPAGPIELVCHPERDAEFEKIKKYF